MDNSVLGGCGILSSPASGFLDLDSLNQRAPPLSYHHHHMHEMGVMRGLETDRSVGMLEPKSAVASKGLSVNCSRGKGISASITTANTATAIGDSRNTSDDADDDERSFTEEGNNAHFNGVKGKKESPWQRMKWTDKVVRLLIMVVSFVGDDGTPDGVAASGPKRKSGSLQKKGKWKMVSRIMMERGCYVSPQQCEDKFNDLNKRYKRLNEILGRGTTCQVVENPILLNSMNHLSSKMKDDVRKILNSKHLFYREMCSYHNGQRVSESLGLDLRGYSMPLTQCSKEGNGFEGDDDEENEDCENDGENEDCNEDEDVERIADLGKRKMNAEDCSFWSQSSGLHDNYELEMAAAVQDTGMKSPLEQHEWIRSRVMQLHEQRVSVQAQAFELEMHRLKWQRFCGKKDRELERLRLENERFRLENERMALQVKKKEMEIYFKRSEVSINPVTTGMD